MPETPPRWSDNDDIVFVYQSRAEIFNIMCGNAHRLMTTMKYPPAISAIKLSEEQILDMIRALGPNKA